MAALTLTATTGTAQRLPATAVPEHYELTFRPDVARATFEGRETVRVRVLQPTESIVMNAVGLEVRDATIETGGRERPAAITLDPARELVSFRTGATLRPGVATLRMTFRGTLKGDLRGFYLSQSGPHRYAVTQLEPTDARRMFPSFDQPEFKATVDLTAVIPSGQTAISNGAVVGRTEGPAAGVHTVRFATTKPIPSYLVALAVGPFECRGRTMSRVQVRVCAPDGKERLTGFALDATAAALETLQDYMAIDYPFGKLDLVAIPDFAAGAMENAGAIFFRESLLLVDADRASVGTRSRVAVVVAHELAHQWFGNLVTMRWWDDLWLNEGFATWMEGKVVAAWRPEWHVDLDEQMSVQRAANLDLLETTRPIRTPVETPSEIQEVFDSIAYQKGAAVVGMVEQFVGRDAFRGAVNAYLERHAYGHATSEDFWMTVARVTRRPEVGAIVRSFVDRPGIPAVDIDLDCRQGRGIVTLSQSRASAAGPRAEATSDPAHRPEPRRSPSSVNAAAGEGDLWAIPMCLRWPSDDTRGTTQECTVLDQRAERLTLDRCVSWAIANPDGTGYFRSVYEPAALAALSRDFATLSPSGQLSVLTDVWSDVRSGRSDVSAFLRLVEGLDDFGVSALAEHIGARLVFVHEYFTTEASRPAFEAWVRRRLSPALADVDARDTRLRAALIRTLAVAGRHLLVLTRARAAVTTHIGAPDRARTDGELLNAYVTAAAISGDEALYEDFLRMSRSADRPEERNRFLFALAAFRDRALLTRTVEYALTPEVRAQDAPLLIARVFDNPDGRVVAWPLVQQHWTAILDKTHGFAGSGRIIDAMGAFCRSDVLDDMERFFRTHPVPSTERTRRQALDRIATCARVAPSQQQGLETWLAGNPAPAAPAARKAGDAGRAAFAREEP